MHLALEGFNTIFSDVTNITWQAAVDVIMLFNHSCFAKEADIEKQTNSILFSETEKKNQVTISTGIT